MMLQPSHITEQLENKDFYDIEIFEVLESTNKTLKSMAATDDTLREGKVILAESQTGGHGRFGRAFFSPAGTGIYMSILLKPRILPTEAPLITTAAAVAVAKALEKICHQPTGIKWINDIFINNRKVCGILTEASFTSTDSFPKYVVLGIGINVFEPDGGFPTELNNIASQAMLSDKNSTPDDINYNRNEIRGKIIASVLDYLLSFYKELPSRNSFLEEYRNRSLVLGKPIRIMDSPEGTPATALSIDDNCNLIVRLENGNTITLNSGEISIKL
ncbi:MAG: biotin--[Lachnospiraceae bacterium]|nr:biotin--[acetyl-CoA-carboxylase] ligase [Lachnospiraceae bacterium]